MKEIKLKEYILSLSIIIILIGVLSYGMIYFYGDINNLVILNNYTLFLASFLQIIIPVIIGILVLYFRNKEIINILVRENLSKINGQVILYGYIMLLAISFGYENLISLFDIQVEKNVFDFFKDTNNLVLLGTFLFFSIFAGIYEELIFRGILFDFFKRILNKIIKNKKIIIGITILLTSILFGVIHLQYSLVIIINVILVGILLGYIRYKFGLINSIIIHMINNGIIVLINMALPALFIFLAQQSYFPERINNLMKDFNKDKNLIIDMMIMGQKEENGNNNLSELSNPYIYRTYLIDGILLNRCVTDFDEKCKYDIEESILKYKKYIILYNYNLITEKDYNNILGFIKYSESILLYNKNKLKDDKKK